MNDLSKLSNPFSLNEARIQAKILLKNFQAENKKLITPLAQIKQIQSWINALHALAADLKINSDAIQLKHTLTVIANEYGFATWTNLKNYFTLTGLTQFEPNGGGFFNQWFSSYKEAKQILVQGGGYLLPYKNQFFICETGYIEYIGLNLDQSDWQNINYNWIEPRDLDAWYRLNALYVSIIKGAHHG